MDPATTAATGGMPGADGMSGQAGATQTSPAGGMPGASTTPSTPPAAAPGGTPAQQPEDVTGLKNALSTERAAAKANADRATAAEAELARLKEAGQSDQEKALTQAKREAAAEERTRWQGHIRTTEVRSQLRAAGLTNDKSLELAVVAPSLTKLRVTDEGTVDGIAEAVSAFKKDHPEMFGTPATPPPGDAWDGSAGGGTGKKPATLEEGVAAHYDKR